MSCIRRLAATAASLFGLGVNSSACGLRASGWESQCSSSGYRSWGARSMWPLGVRTPIALTMSSLPGCNDTTIPRDHTPLFLESDLTITTSPTSGWYFGFLCARLCRSRKATKYSFSHLFQSWSLQDFRYLARLRRSRSLIWCVACSGSWVLRLVSRTGHPTKVPGWG